LGFITGGYNNQDRSVRGIFRKLRHGPMQLRRHAHWLEQRPQCRHLDQYANDMSNQTGRRFCASSEARAELIAAGWFFNSDVEDCTITACSTCVPSEQYGVLTALYEALDGDNWNWSDPSKSWKDASGRFRTLQFGGSNQWEGVTLDANCNIIGIDLSQKSLNGSLPSEALCNLPQLSKPSPQRQCHPRRTTCMPTEPAFDDLRSGL
jgi:hypothetical protein